MTWSPLACGIISGKYGNGVPESSRASLKVFSSTSRKESGDRSKGKKETEQNSSAAACGSLAQAECGLGLALAGSPSPLEVSTSGQPSVQEVLLLWGPGEMPNDLVGFVDSNSYTYSYIQEGISFLL